MDTIPRRRPVATSYRAVTDFLERRIKLPAINPAIYQAAAIAASLVYLYIDTTGAKASLIAFILLMDWLDGATARQHGQMNKVGYMKDVVVDRASEMIIFAGEAGTSPGNVFFLLSLINIGLAYNSIRTGKHTSLPLRCAWLLILLLPP